jgi:hypothetical protein
LLWLLTNASCFEYGSVVPKFSLFAINCMLSFLCEWNYRARQKMQF